MDITIKSFDNYHVDEQIRVAMLSAHARNKRLVRLVYLFLMESTQRAKTDHVNEELAYVRKSGNKSFIEEPHPVLREALKAAREVHKQDWTGVLVEYSDLLCEPGKGLVCRLVPSYKLEKKSHLITYILLLNAAHHYGYEFEE